MTEKMKDIQSIKNIEDKYGLLLFRMGLTHLVDVGHRNLNNSEVEESIAEITAQAEKDRANGKIPIMTPEFQCDIVRCAAELTQFSPWALFAYIKKYIVISNT